MVVISHLFLFFEKSFRGQKQWKKIKTKYRMLKASALEHWRARGLACNRKMGT